MKPRQGFTLIELVVVILILGVIAGVAAPILFDVSTSATDDSLKQSLSFIQDAINLYEAVIAGQVLGADGNQNTFKNDAMPYIRRFPECPVGADPTKLDLIKMEGGGIPLSSQTGAALDRLTHRCQIIETKGESYRLKDARRRCRKK